jgi:hypothetical protein
VLAQVSRVVHLECKQFANQAASNKCLGQHIEPSLAASSSKCSCLVCNHPLPDTITTAAIAQAQIIVIIIISKAVVAIIVKALATKVQAPVVPGS